MKQYFNFRDMRFNNSNNPSLTETTSDVRKRTTSLIGVSKSGIPFVPKTFRKFKFNSISNDLDSFEIHNGSFSENHKEFQGRILPYIAAYSTLERQSQLNFTRLLGIELDQTEYPGLLPGFNLNTIENNQDYHIYIISLKINQDVIDSLKNTYNYHLLTNNNDYYFATILTKKCELSSQQNFLRKNDTNYFKLTLISNDESFKDNTNAYNSGDFRDNINVDKNKNLIFSLNVDDEYFWKKSLNDNIQRLDDFGYCLLNYDDVLNNLYISSKHIFRLDNNIPEIELKINELTVNDYKNFNQGFTYSSSPWVVSQGFYSHLETSNREDLKDRVKKLFKIHAINPGKIGNNLRIKIRPLTLKNDDNEAAFDLFVYDISKNVHQPIISFNNLTLNKDSNNFIARRIGDKKQYFDILQKRIIIEGEYDLQNNLIRVELSDDIINSNHTSHLIPAGFTNEKNIKSNIIDNLTLKQIKNDFIIQPIYSEIVGNKFSLSDFHTWGKNFYHIKETDDIAIDKFTSGSATMGSIFSKENIKFKLINYLTESKDIIKINNYLNPNFYGTIDEIDNNMFHLEKILLLNEYNEISNIFRQNWKFSKYNKNILNKSALLLPENALFYNNFFASVANINPYYFFTISDQRLTSNQTSQTDSLEEAQSHSNLINILDFSFEMNGGWDGLNILNLDEYCITDIGLNRSQYLREIYKIAFDVIIDESNGQNEIIYLPEIFNIDVLQYISNQLSSSRYSILLLDKPFVKSTNEIIYSSDFLIQNNLQNKKWSDMFFEYKNIDALPQINITNTFNNFLENQFEISNISSFFNYVLCQINKNASSNNSLINSNLNYVILPAGLIALYILNHYERNSINTMNPLYNNEISQIGQFNILFNITDFLNKNHIINDINKEYIFQSVNKSTVNFLYQDIVNQKNIYRFMSDKTNTFTFQNNLITSSLNVRSTLNEIKRKIKLLSYLFLFENIKDRAELTKKLNVIYSIFLTDIKKKQLIEDFKINLDENTTSYEDVLNNIVRGSIFLKFRSSQQMIKIDL